MLAKLTFVVGKKADGSFAVIAGGSKAKDLAGYEKALEGSDFVAVGLVRNPRMFRIRRKAEPAVVAAEAPVAPVAPEAPAKPKAKAKN